MKEKTLKILGEYLGQSERNKLEEMRKLEGSNYGIHGMGYYDPVFILLHRLQVSAYGNLAPTAEVGEIIVIVADDGEPLTDIGENGGTDEQTIHQNRPVPPWDDSFPNAGV